MRGENDGSGARAPATVTTSSPFDISIKGGDDATRNQPVAIKTLIDRAIAVRIYAQASGSGNAMATVSDNKDELGAGDRDREVTIVYTAAGAINNGMLKLTVPDGWSHPLMENFKITSTGSIGSSSASDFGGYYVGNPDDESDDKEFPETNSPGCHGCACRQRQLGCR